MESSASSGLRLRGGRKQRKRALEQLAPGEQGPEYSLPKKNKFDSEHAFSLVKKWAWGKSSAAEIQREASSALADQKRLLRRVGKPESIAMASLAKIAGLGNSGKRAGNISAELKRWLGEPQMPIDYFPVMVKISKPRMRAARFSKIRLPFCLPHQIFSYYFKNDYPGFVDRFVGGGNPQEKLEGFWREVASRRDPRIAKHPMCLVPGWQRRAVPILLHGDGVPVARIGRAGAESADFLSIQSLLTTGPSFRTKMMMASIFQKSKAKTSGGFVGTEDTIWKILAWSFRALLKGRFPASDYKGNTYPKSSSAGMLAGQRLCTDEEPFFAVLWSVCGDLDWYSKSLQLRAYGANKLCPFCPCDKDGPPAMWPTNFSADSPWKRLLHSPELWRSLPDESKHPLFTEIPAMSVWNIDVDELHVLFLGVYQYALGSTLYLLTYRLDLGPPDAAFATIWADILQEYRSEDIVLQFTHLSTAQFLDSKKSPHNQYPRLKGRASELKGVLRPMMNVWQKRCTGSSRDQRLLRMLQALCSAQDIMDDNKRLTFLPRSDVTAYQKNIDIFLREYSKLGASADDQAELLWSAVPKLHYLWHLSNRSIFLNPRRCATWSGEDFMKVCKTIAAKACVGNRLEVVPSKIMDRYRWGVHLSECSFED